MYELSEGDKQLGVEFFMEAVENKRKSEAEKRPIFDDVEMVRIIIPGDTKRKPVFRAHEMHYVPAEKRQMTYAERFPGQYKAFRENIEDFVSGTPLSELPFLTVARRAEMKHLGIVTVEQLAGLQDNNMKKLGMDGRGIVEKAKAYLAAAKDTAEVDDLRRQVAELKAQIGTVTGPTVGYAQPETDPYEGFEDDDLRNMIKDGGGKVPPGRASRATLISALNDMARAKEAA